MNEIFLGNLRLISNAVLWFSNFFGINTPEFTEALTGTVVGSVHAYYEEKGVKFDIEKDALTEEPMLAAYDKIMGIAQLASLAASCGLKPEDFQQ